MGETVHVVVVPPRLGERAHLSEESLRPRRVLAGLLLVLGYEHLALRNQRRDDVQALHLVRLARVVSSNRYARPLQLLHQGDARGLVLHQDQVRLPALRECLVRAVHHLLEVRDDLLSELGVGEVSVPRVQ